MLKFIQGLPKVELHVHIEGTLEPELLFHLAKRNHISIPYSSPGEVKQAYEFENLKSFLEIYYQGAHVLVTEQDFYDLTWHYLLRCQQDNVLHTEIFFDPQTHTDRGISFDCVINGIHRALKQGESELGISSRLIMCFLRHLDEESAIETLNQALPHKDKIVAVGLDSSELGHPPEKFVRVFQMALKKGFYTVAHAGEEGPANNICDVIGMFGVSRIGHGVRCTDLPKLVDTLNVLQLPLTVCPLSNIKLKVFPSMADHNIAQLLRYGLCVTINSDDPAYFGGYITENFIAVAEAHQLNYAELARLTQNAIEASFISDQHKTQLHETLDRYLVQCN